MPESKSENNDTAEGCGCTELCSMGPTCPGGMLARLPGTGCHRSAESDEFTFTGSDRWGVAHTGSLGGSVKEFVERRYEARWQHLDVRQDGVQAGGIQREDDGRLTWWAEAPQVSTPPGAPT